MDEPFWETNLILKLVAGDHAYGLDTPGQTPEVRAVCIPPHQELPGQTSPEQWEHLDEQGRVLTYALPTFIQRALACDPAIIELLYTAPDYILFVNTYGQRLFEHRDLFLSMRARHTFTNAALSRLKQIERHRHWLLDPPNHEPTPEAFGKSIEMDPRTPDCEAQQAYQDVLADRKQYQIWCRNQDPARAEREREYGYDTADAMHAIRLLAMGAEILEISQVRVHRHDREWLRSVRDGALLYDELRDLVPVCLARLDRLSRLSSLPEQPDVAVAQALAIELQEQYLSRTE